VAGQRWRRVCRRESGGQYRSVIQQHQTLEAILPALLALAFGVAGGMPPERAPSPLPEAPLARIFLVSRPRNRLRQTAHKP